MLVAPTIDCGSTIRGGGLDWRGWTPDGRYLRVVRNRVGSGSPLWEPTGSRGTPALWRISLEDGKAEKLGPTFHRGPLSLHPDGRQVAFTCGGRVSEVWAIENFLPELKAAQ